MRLIVPFTNVNTASFVRNALLSEGLQPAMIELLHDESYWQLLAECWRQGEPFIVVEHDVIPAWGALRKMADCPGRWCTSEILIGGGLHPATFGCVKFDARAMQAKPHIFADMDSRDWRGLDSRFARDIAPLRPHVHQPPAHHLNPAHWKAQ